MAHRVHQHHALERRSTPRRCAASTGTGRCRCPSTGTTARRPAAPREIGEEAVRARREPDGIAGRERREPRAQRPVRHDDEVELVRRLVRRIHERVRPADHRLDVAGRRRQREARELSRDELDVRAPSPAARRGSRVHSPLARHAPFHPCRHYGTFRSRKIAIMPTRPRPRPSPAHVSTSARRATTTRPRSWPRCARAARCTGRGRARRTRRARYAAFVARFAPAGAYRRTRAFSLYRRDDHALLGVFNFSEIVRGAFQSTYLGYFGFAPLRGAGLHDRRHGARARRRVPQARSCTASRSTSSPPTRARSRSRSASASRAKAFRAAT